MKLISAHVIMSVTLIFALTACGETPPADLNKNDQFNANYTPGEKELNFEKYISEIDANDSLTVGNSLYYSKEGGESVEVIIFVNKKNETVKLIESYTSKGTMSINSNTFYMKNGKKYASRELFEAGKSGDLYFAERVTYYNEKEKPLVSKIKTAPYEEELVLETFQITEAKNCSMKRTLAILNQEGEFATTFQGFIKQDPFTYIIVGEDEFDGFSSSLVVQYVDKTIQTLLDNEKEMIGKGMKIDFEKLDSGEGYTYQILLRAALR